jgi:outer membrane immunogenic protein
MRKRTHSNNSRNGSYQTHQWFATLALITLALTTTGLLSISAFAQTANKSGQEQYRNLGRNRIAEKAVASLRLIEPSATVSRSESPKPLAPAPLPSNWAGGYVGFHLGYGWGRANTSFTPLPSATAFINLAPTTLRPDPHGVHAGGQVGYNWQSGSVVGGFESDISWTNMKGTAVVTPIIQNNGSPWAGTLTAHQDTDWFGTLRARLGGSVGSALIYGTGGLAYAKVNYSANADFRPQGTIQYPSAFSKTKTGWTVGGGVEFAINNHWGVKGEYLYYKMSNESRTANPSPANPPFQVAYTWQTRAHILRGGLNYHF